ncbi:MAG: hypothetical protein RLN76_07360 [Phycisphaeraceae bacterium]
MSIKVRSPYSGVEVAVRSEDVGRALRDESGRVFYVIARGAGGGYYGSKVRAGSESDEAQARRWAEGESLPVSSGGAAVHDARGSGGRRSSAGWVVAVLVIVLLASGGWWVWRSGVLSGGTDSDGVGDVPVEEIEPDAVPADGGGSAELITE